MNSASPIVLLHGVGLDKTMWHAFAGELQSDWRALDLPGHGGQPPLRREQTLASMAEDVLGRLPDGRVHLVGFSLGSLIAQYIARFAPDRVLSLTCVSSVCHRTAAERVAVEARLNSAKVDFAASVAASIDRWYPAGTPASDEAIERTRRTLLHNDVESYLHAYAVFAHGDAEIGPELGSIRCPTLAITGERDPGSTPEMSERLAAAIPDSRVIVVPNARHMLPIESAVPLRESITSLIAESKGVTL